jgi:hypothetical protein
MGMIDSIQERLRVPVLLLGAISMVVFAGCKGAKDAPFGSTVTIERMAYIHNSPQILDTSWERWRVSVADPNGLPLNGIEVTLDALIGQGQDVTINGAVGSAGDELVTKLTMGDGGYQDFLITASTQAISPIGFPDPVSAVAGVNGGTLPDGTYAYIVSAVDAVGGEAVSNETTPVIISNATTSADSVTVTWTDVPGAAAYNVYGRTSGAEGLLYTAPATTTMWTDKGTPASPGASPPLSGTNTTGVASNIVKAVIGASTGATTAVGTVDFSNNN